MSKENETSPYPNNHVEIIESLTMSGLQEKVNKYLYEENGYPLHSGNYELVNTQYMYQPNAGVSLGSNRWREISERHIMVLRFENKTIR